LLATLHKQDACATVISPKNAKVWKGDKMQKIFLILLIVCISISGCIGDFLNSLKPSEKVVSVSTLYDYPPYCFTTEPIEEIEETLPPGEDSTIFRGYSWDIFRESFHGQGYTIKLFVTQWVKAMDYVKNGNVDILFPAGKNAERQKIFYYSNESVNDTNFLVYVRHDSQIEWNGLDSLNGLTIGVMKGWNYGDDWNAHSLINEHELDTAMEGFEMLDEGKLDGFAGYEVNFDYVLKQAGWGNKYKKLPVFESASEYVIGLQANPDVPNLLRDFDEGKRQIIENGTFDSIVKKWQ